MPSIILIVDILLYSSDIDGDRTIILGVFRSVECLSAMADIVQQMSPLLDILFKHAINLSTLKIPKGLVLLPLLIVSITLSENFLEGFIGLSDIVVLHLLDETHVGSIPIVVLASIFTISLGFNSS